VPFKEIVLPSQFAGNAQMNWARDRATLWNAAEHAGRRRNALLAREVVVALHPEMSLSQRVQLTRSFAQDLADRYGSAVDVAVHFPRSTSDPRNHHAHLLMTSRQVTPEGLGARTILELSGQERRARGLRGSKDELLFMRERWANRVNEAFREAGLSSRVDHRSYAAQGIDREPKPYLPRKVFYAERSSGKTTPAGDAIRERYSQRVEAREKGPAELARVVKKQRDEAYQRMAALDGAPVRPRQTDLTAEEVAKEAVRRWREYRQSLGPEPTTQDIIRDWRAYRDREHDGAESGGGRDRGRDDDYGL
jgi:ATP-dependent exoDNAse (exonuclease V) alpha subunit